MTPRELEIAMGLAVLWPECRDKGGTVCERILDALLQAAKGEAA